MATKGKRFDLNCGAYSYEVIPPVTQPLPPPGSPAPTLGQQKCNPISRHEDVERGGQARYASISCRKQADFVFDASQNAQAYSYIGLGHAPPCYFYMSWIKDCKTSEEKQERKKPLKDNGATCESLMLGNYLNCERC